MWLTRDMSDPNNEMKFHIEFHKDFDMIIEKYKKQIEKRITPVTDGMIKPHIVKYLDRIKFVVSTIKEQTTSELGQDTSRRETLGEVDSLRPRPIDLTTSSEIGENSPLNVSNAGLISNLNSYLTSGDDRDFGSPSPETERIVHEGWHGNHGNAVMGALEPRRIDFPRTLAQVHASELKRRNNDQ